MSQNLFHDKKEPLLGLQLPNLHRATLDLSGQSWLPYSNLDAASLPQVCEIEETLDRSLGRENHHFIHVGRNQFELVGADEALALRTERSLREQTAVGTSQSQLDDEARLSLANCVVFSGRSSVRLGKSICDSLAISPGAITSGEFLNGETRISIDQSVRDRDVFVIQSLAKPVNDSLMELVLSADALKRASARSITAVIPYFAYSRQEKKGGVRGPISARAVADMLQSVGVDRVVTLDIHAEAIEGFFSIPFDNLAAFPLMVPHLVTKYGSDKITLVSPDAGGMSRVVAASQILSRYIVRMDSSESLEGESPIRIEGMYKRRARPNEVAEMRFIGDGDGARDATCILVDDIYDTGGSALTAARALRAAGAKRVVICTTHPIFSKGGLENCRASKWDDGSPLVHEIVTTDSLPLRRAQGDLVTVVSSQSLLAEAIRRICCGQAASLRELQGFCGLTD